MIDCCPDRSTDPRPIGTRACCAAAYYSGRVHSSGTNVKSFFVRRVPSPTRTSSSTLLLLLLLLLPRLSCLFHEPEHPHSSRKFSYSDHCLFLFAPIARFRLLWREPASGKSRCRQRPCICDYGRRTSGRTDLASALGCEFWGAR